MTVPARHLSAVPQPQRHWDDGGAALLARQGKACLADVADAPRKYAGTGHAARMARANESGVEMTRRRFYVFCWISSRVTSRRSAAKRSEEHTSELQSLMRNSYAVFCLTKKKTSQ